MPTGIYERTKKYKLSKETLQKRKERPGQTTGMHWKIKDVSKMSKASKANWKKQSYRQKQSLNKGTTGMHWKIKDTSRMRIKRTKEFKQNLHEYQINHPNRKFTNTKIEQKIATELLKRRVYFQQNVGLCNIANVDFYLPEYRIVIECDGCYYHNCLIHFPECHKKTREADGQKTRILIFNGFNVYRFWEHEINKSAKECIDKIIF